MSHIVWTPHAAEQLKKLYKFLSEKNEDAARKALEVIQINNSGYVLLYQVQDEIVYILVICHQREFGYI